MQISTADYCGTPTQAKTIVTKRKFEALVAVHGYAFSLAEPARVYRAHGMQASKYTPGVFDPQIPNPKNKIRKEREGKPLQDIAQVER